jgi:dolichol-phosphate mannosyltransferase
MENLLVSVIMPALNEEENIRAAIENTMLGMDKYQIPGELIIVNDGSADKTEALVKEAMEMDHRIKMIRHEHPMGIGRSFWDGVDISRGEAIVMLPGDNENNSDEILRYFGLLDHVDIIIPFVFNKNVRSLFRNALSFTYRFIINTTFIVNFNYTNGTVLYRKSVLEALNHQSRGFFFQTDILIRAVKSGYIFAEVPLRLEQRNSGDSKAVSFPSLIQVIRGYIRLFRDIYYHPNGKIAAKYAENSKTKERN